LYVKYIWLISIQIHRLILGTFMILYINAKLLIAKFVVIAWKPLPDFLKAFCIMTKLMHGDRKNVYRDS